MGKLSLSGGSEARDEVAPDAVLHSRANRDALTLAVGEEGRELVGQDSVPMPAVSPEIGRGPVADGNAGDEPERRQKLAEAVPMATLDLALQGEQVHPAVCPGGKAGVVQAMQKLEEQTCVVHAELTHAEAALVLGNWDIYHARFLICSHVSHIFNRKVILLRTYQKFVSCLMELD